MMKKVIGNRVARLICRLTRKAKVVVLSILVLALAGCLPVGEEHVNTELFKSKEEMKVRTAKLKPGISKKQAFESVGVPQEKFEHMNTAEIQASVYGNSQARGTPEQLEDFKNRLLRYEGYALPYKELKNDQSIGFGTMKFMKKGHDLRLVMIFEKDRLLRASVEGNEEVSMEEDQFMWTTLLRRGIGMAF